MGWQLRNLTKGEVLVLSERAEKYAKSIDKAIVKIRPGLSSQSTYIYWIWSHAEKNGEVMYRSQI